MIGNRPEPVVQRFLVLGGAGDAGAAQVAAALGQRHGTAAVAFVSDVDLARASWIHRQGAGGTTSRVVLGDGRVLTHDGFDLVFNRLRSVFPSGFAGADEADRQYAGAELNALALSWLAGFACPVVPAPAPPALSPVLPSLPDLLASAGRVGLSTRRFAFSSNARLFPDDASPAFPGETALPAGGPAVEPTPRYLLGRDPALSLEAVAGTPRRLLVVGDDVLGPIPEGLGPSCVRFADARGCEVLALLWDRRDAPGNADSRWCLCGADSHPDFETRDEALAVARYLDRRATQGSTEHGTERRSDT